MTVVSLIEFIPANKKIEASTLYDDELFVMMKILI